MEKGDKPDEAPGKNPKTRRETRDLNPFGILMFGIALTVFAVVVHVALAVAVHLYKKHAERQDRTSFIAAETEQLHPYNKLDVDILAQLEDLRKREYAQTHEYALVDRPAGVIAIPVERAMDILAQRGLPARSSAPRDEIPQETFK